MIKNAIKLEIFTQDRVISSRIIDLNDWYNEDVEEIDSNKVRELNHITKITGSEFGNNGEIQESWLMVYDSFGRLVKSARYNEDNILIDSEELKYDADGKIITNN